MEKRIKASRIESVPSRPSNTGRKTTISHGIGRPVPVPQPSFVSAGSELSIGKVIAWIVAGFFILLIIAGMSGGGSSKPKHNPNGGYMDLEVITDKIDRGQKPTPAEEKRLNDILFDPRWDGDN